MTQDPSADRQFRVALLGYGVGGRVFHTPLVSATAGLDLRYVVTQDRASAPEIAQRYGVPTLDSPDLIWQRSDELDLIVISTPNPTHVDLARRAISLGLNVVVDKPAAPTAAQARALIEEAAQAGVMFTVFQNRRWDGDFLTLRALIEQGTLGEVYEIESRFSWWQPEGRAGWKAQTPVAEGGGALYDLGPHLIDQAVQLLGPVTDGHAEFDARHSTSRNEDDCFVSLLHQSGARSRLWMSSITPLAGPRLSASGSRAGFRSVPLDPQEAQSVAGLRPDAAGFGVYDEPATLGTDGNVRTVPVQPGRYRDFYDGVVNALAHATRPPVDPRDSADILEVIERLHQDASVRHLHPAG